MHNHNNHFIKEGDTLIITKEFELYHFYASTIEDDTVKLCVYDYTKHAIGGIRIMDHKEVLKVINQSDNEYSSYIKKFFSYLADNLANTDKELYLFIINVWNADNEKINPIVLNDPGYENKAGEYLEDIVSFNYDTSIGYGAIIFKDLYDESFVRPRYNEAYKIMFKLK